MEVTYRVSNRDLVEYIRMLVRMGGEEEWIPLRDIDLHVAYQAFVLQALSEHRIILTKAATRAFTRRESNYTYTPKNGFISHVKLAPDFAEKAREAGL